MTDTILLTIDNILFFCALIAGAYLFIYALSTLFRKQGKYHKAEKQHRFVLLVPHHTEIKEQKYPENLYTVIVYEDLFQTIQQLDESQYDMAIILGETTRISSSLLRKINNAFDTGVMAIQLHHIIDPRVTRKIHRQAIHEEISNSIFRQGHTWIGLSSALDKLDIAIDLQWLKQNMKSVKSNIENRLLRQNIYIEYLDDVYVYSTSPRPLPAKIAKWKALKKLPEILMEGNWDYANKLFRQLLPSWKILLILTAAWCLLISFFDWRSSLKWWLYLFGLLFTVSLAIPDYLIEKHRKIHIFPKKNKQA